MLLTADLVDVLEGQAEGLVGGAAGGQDGVEGLQQGGAVGVSVLALHLPSLEPAHLQRTRTAGQNHVWTQLGLILDREWGKLNNQTASHLAAGLQHVVSVPSGDGHEGHGGGVVADLLDVLADLLGDLLVAGLAVGGLGVVHLVDANDELLHPQGEGQQGVLAGLAVGRDTGLKLTHTSGNDQHGAVSLQTDRRQESANSWTFRAVIVMYIATAITP